MNKIMLSLVFLFSAFGSIDAVVNFEEIYPYVVQRIDDTVLYHGDRHGDFAGDFVAVLTDGSAWKVHPTQSGIYQNWNVGDLVRIKVRTDFYFFKREHKFELYNYTSGQSVKVMLVKSIDIPYPLTIVNTDFHIARYITRTHSKVESYYDAATGLWKSHTVIYHTYDPVYRKTLVMSDGSVWVIRDHFGDYTLGNKVYIGAQGEPGWYDFILITGTEREAVWTYARSPK